jgi:hypothetical protein
MKNVGKTAAKVILCLMLSWQSAATAPAQSDAQPTPTPPAPAAATAPTPTPDAASIAIDRIVRGEIRGTLKLDSPWRFQAGDNTAWADPAIDDTHWDPIKPGAPLDEQGFENYTGYAWYRLRLRPGAAPTESHSLSLLVVPNEVGQMEVFVNGEIAARTRGMIENPVLYQSPPLVVDLSPAAAKGPVLIAIRTWSSEPLRTGPIESVQIGDAASTAENLQFQKARQWERVAIADILAGFLFICVAGLAATLFYSQRNHPEYLWLALLCIAVAVRGIIDASFGLEALSQPAYALISPWAMWLFIVTTLEFVLTFTGKRHLALVRGFQAAALLLPLVSLLHFDEVFKYLLLASQFLFYGLIVFMLYRAWRRGRPEAGVMLIPFFLAAAADSSHSLIVFATKRNLVLHLGPVEFSSSTITYLVFLGSLIAVILYRFILVSEEEQRSAAEIEAARGVQSMLIPTQLPSNRNFMLEGAYLPAFGVGGDFFQVLPLKDDSLLIVVGDVSGKGLRAAMNASTLVGALRNELSHDPATVLNHLNQVMISAISGTGANNVAGFATCLCARIHTDGRMIVANAGHLNPYRDGREIQLPPDLPLGIIPNMAYEEAAFRLSPGDRLVFLSDGVVEATNAHGELFGFERTQQVSNESARYISQTAQRFGQNDDITVVSLYFAASSSARTDRVPVSAF